MSAAKSVIPEDAEDLRRIEELLSLSRAMCAAAEAQDWEQLGALEGQRGRVLAEFFAASHSPNTGPALIACMRQILDMNTGVIERGESALRDIADKLGEMHRGGRALKAYQDTGTE